MNKPPFPLFSDPTILMTEKIDRVSELFIGEIHNFWMNHGVQPDGLIMGSDTFRMLKEDPRLIHGVVSINAKDDTFVGIKVYGAINVPYDYIQCFRSDTK